MSLKSKIKKEMTTIEYLRDFFDLLGVGNVSFQVFEDEMEEDSKDVYLEFESDSTLKQINAVLNFFTVEPEDISFRSTTSDRSFYVIVRM